MRAFPNEPVPAEIAHFAVDADYRADERWPVAGQEPFGARDLDRGARDARNSADGV